MGLYLHSADFITDGNEHIRFEPGADSRQQAYGEHGQRQSQQQPRPREYQTGKAVAHGDVTRF